ncbi:hypothetical protein SARC_03867 [Sphaeroforma arctica JP610]|uniref:Uncharacterized protein n=1 Tax=Sphaeroforma arctica JP610 TaxID=667725 RepID=A0A0L0G6P6_9EUKA|nr:hypothetical protein SARC_03867 [Sphaeroforma arctica JP610]KNC83908.1 hypothetical protein SARC_03867 [Sphaeroforma arctica JP610]|eukprot:XP_014157810.1 hypothetical protein SARC_03867 [Sphaeroforma arctica JP610]
MSEAVDAKVRPCDAIQHAASTCTQPNSNTELGETGRSLICEPVKMTSQTVTEGVVQILSVSHASGEDSTPFISSAESSPNDITDNVSESLKIERKPSAKWTNKMRRNLSNWIRHRDKAISSNTIGNDHNEERVGKKCIEVSDTLAERVPAHGKERLAERNKAGHLDDSTQTDRTDNNIEHTQQIDIEYRALIARQLSAPQPFHDFSQANNATVDMQSFKVSARRVRKASAPDTAGANSQYLNRLLDGETEPLGTPKYISRDAYRNERLVNNGNKGEILHHRAARDQKFVFNKIAIAQDSSRKYLLSKSAASLISPTSAPNMTPSAPSSANSMDIRSLSRDQICPRQVQAIPANLASPRSGVMTSPCSPRRSSIRRRMTYDDRSGSLVLRSVASEAPLRDVRSSPVMQISSPRNRDISPRNMDFMSPRNRDVSPRNSDFPHGNGDMSSVKKIDIDSRRLRNVSSAEPSDNSSSFLVHDSVKRSSSDRMFGSKNGANPNLKLGQAARWIPSDNDDSTGPPSRGSSSTTSTSLTGRKETDHEHTFGDPKNRDSHLSKSLRHSFKRWLPGRKPRSKSTSDAMGQHPKAAVELLQERSESSKINSPLELQKSMSLSAADQQTHAGTHTSVHVPISNPNTMTNRSQYILSSFSIKTQNTNARGQISVVPAVARSRTYSPSYHTPQGARDASPLSLSGSPFCMRRRSFAQPQRDKPLRLLTAAQAATTDSLPGTFRQQLSGGLKRAWLFSSGSAPTSRRMSEASPQSSTVSEDEELIYDVDPASNNSRLPAEQCSEATVRAMQNFNSITDAGGQWHTGAKRSSSLGTFPTPSRSMLQQYTCRLDKYNSTGTTSGSSSTSLDMASERSSTAEFARSCDGILDCAKRVNTGTNIGFQLCDGEAKPVSIRKGMSSNSEDTYLKTSMEGLGLETINDDEVLHNADLGYGVYERNTSVPEIYNDYHSDYYDEITSGWDSCASNYDGIIENFALDELHMGECYDEEEMLGMITETEDEDVQTELDPGEMSAAEATRASKIATAKVAKHYSRGSDLSKSMYNLRLSTDAISELAEQ